MGPRPLRRVTRAELENTLRDLFNLEGPLDLALPDEPLVDGFDNAASAANISEVRAEGMLDMAERVAHLAVAHLDRLFPCESGRALDACAEAFVRAVGRRAFRRALTEQEVDRFKEVWASSGPISEDLVGRVELVLTALLMSPELHFRIERGDVTREAPPGLVALTGPEIATRLSFLIFASTPDERLLAVAEAGGLSSREGIDAEVTRMLQDPRARRGLARFFDQWLELDAIERLDKDPTRFPEWSGDLARSMQEETTRFVQDVLWSKSAKLDALFSSRETSVDARLAPIYGVAVDADASVHRVTLPEQERHGILTSASFLARHAHSQETSPVQRGLFVRRRLLCQDLPPPPTNLVITPPPADPSSTNRARLEAHASNPACVGCHRLMDPVGFAFENYDALGRFRLNEPSGLPIDATGAVEAGGPGLGPVTGAIELSEQLASSDEVAVCVVHQVFRYAEGRREGTLDVCALANLESRFLASRDLLDLVRGLAVSDAFRYRPVVGD